MIFEEALKAMRTGERVKRSSVFLEYCLSADGQTMAMRVTECDTIRQWSTAAFTGADILATDWEIVSDKERGE
jgi:hypothetical protein